MATSTEDIGSGLRAFAIVMIVIPIIAIILRFWSRCLISSRPTKYYATSIKAKLWWDDWFALFGLPISIASNALEVYSVDLGVGRHFNTIQPDTQLQILKILYITYFVYDVAITLPKFSALFFYRRVFGSGNKPFAIALWVGHFLIAAWLVGILVMTVFLCTPSQKYYEPTVPGYCMNLDTAWLASAIPSVVIDVYILTLPMPMLWKLQLKLTRKLLLLGVFVCGYCVILVSLGRLVTIILAGDNLNVDLTWIGVEPLYWLAAEAPLSILSVCLPSIFFLFRRASRHGFISLLTTRTASELEATAASKSAIKTGLSTKAMASRDDARNGSSDNSTEMVALGGGNADTGYTARAYEASPSPARDGRVVDDVIRVRNEVHVTDEETKDGKVLV